MAGVAYWLFIDIVSLCTGFAWLELLAKRWPASATRTTAAGGRRVTALLVPLSAIGLLIAVDRLMFGLLPAVLAPLLGLLALSALLGWWGHAEKSPLPAIIALGWLITGLADRATESLLLPRATPVAGAPTLPASGAEAAFWLGLHQILAGIGLAAFLVALAAALRRGDPRSRPMAAFAVAAGLLALAPQPAIGYFYARQLMIHYTPAWAMLMNGAGGRAWYFMSVSVVSLLVWSAAGVWLTRVYPWREGRLSPAAVAAGLAALLGGLAWSIAYGGSIMTPDFTRKMTEAAVAASLAAAATGAVSVRAVLSTTAVLAVLSLVFMATAWSQATARLAYRNHVLPRPRPSVAALPQAQIIQGRLLAGQIGCFTCHGVNGSADRRNPGDPLEWVPSWSSPMFARVFDGRDGRQKLWTLLWKGQYAYRTTYYPDGRNWSVRFHTIDNYFNVPAWNGILTESQMYELIAYIQSLAPSSRVLKGRN